MIPLTLTAELAIGQCQNGRCTIPRPQSSWVMPWLNTTPAAPQIALPVISKYRVKVDGVEFEVDGWKDTSGLIHYKYTPENIKAKKDAEAEKRTRETPPVNEPYAGQAVPKKNFGIDLEKLKKDDIEYRTSGPVAQKFVAEARNPSVAEQKFHVTVIGQKEEREKVVNDLKNDPELTPFSDRLYIQSYAPTDWPVNPALGFDTSGKPTILIQTAKSKADPEGGKVLWHAKDYKTGPRGLAEALRKVNPRYRPDLDPGPDNGFLDNLKLPNSSLLLVGGLILAMLIFLPKKDNS